MTASEAAELIRRLIEAGYLTDVGEAYPAMAADPEAEKLINEFGRGFGPWQLLEHGDHCHSSAHYALLALDPVVRNAIAAMAGSTE